jgi:hypothetical protein
MSYQNEDIVDILNKIRDQIDELKMASNNATHSAYNYGIVDSMSVIENWIEEYSVTPNDLKRKAGLYHN